MQSLSTKKHYTIRAIYNDGAVIEVTGSTKKIAEKRYCKARNEAQRWGERPIFQIETPRGVVKEVTAL